MAREEQSSWWHSERDYQREGITSQTVRNAYGVMQALYFNDAGIPQGNFNDIALLNAEIDGFFNRVTFGQQTRPLPTTPVALTAATIGDTLTVMDYLQEHGSQTPYATGTPLGDLVASETLGQIDMYLTEQYIALTREERAAEIAALVAQHSKHPGLRRLRYPIHDPLDISDLTLKASDKPIGPVIRAGNYSRINVQKGRSCVIQGNIGDLSIDRGDSVVVLGNVGLLHYYGGSGKTEIVGKVREASFVSGNNLTIIGELDHLPPTDSFLRSFTVLGRIAGGPLQRKPIKEP